MVKFGYKTKSDFDSTVLDIRRVTRVVAGGKRFSFRASVVVGNKNGKVGVGVAKGSDVRQAVEKATRDARKNLIEIPIISGTIPHESFGKFSSSRVMLKPAFSDIGIRAGGAVRVVCSLGGIKNIVSKILGRTTNKLTNARAAIEALRLLKTKNQILNIKNKDADTPIKTNS